ncbi:M67 family metallopeptidase [uncultured Sutterella sp.]|uniref:M67 family metallopeptidase n=1 Tax=uncultured Sutterella sp. TaxID=286133 RepID=UPI002600AA92|nr:M67 family metallopeptidase [uncultured Sutterella sp.]
MIRIPRAEFNRMLGHARSEAPLEACGLAAGRALDGDVREVVRIIPLPNAHASPAHFTIDPKAQLAALKAIRAEGLELLGNWHSHPATPARPSLEDRRHAHDPRASYLILSLADAAPVLRSFRFRDAHAGCGALPELVEEPLELVG